jgi:hypothetical protein
MLPLPVRLLIALLNAQRLAEESASDALDRALYIGQSL